MARAPDSQRVGLTEATFRGLVWITSSAVAQAVLRVVVIAFLARLIGPESFGLMAAAVVVLSLSDILSQVGTGAALVQKKEITERHIGSAYVLSAVIGVGLGVALWFLAPLIEQGMSMPGLAAILKALAWVPPMSAIGKPASRLLQRRLQFRFIALAESASYFVGWVVVGLGLALLGFGVWALVAAHGMANFLLACSMLVASWRSITLRSSWSAARDLVTFGGGVSVSTVFLFVGMNLDRLLIGQAFGAYQLGLYSRALDLMGRLYKVADSAISKTLFPAFSSRQDETSRLRQAYLRAVKVVGLICLPLAAVTVVLSDEIVMILFGPAWLDAAPILQLAILILLPRVLSKLSGSLAFGLGRAYSVAAIRGAYVGLMLGGLWIACRHSLLMAAQTVLIVEALHAGLLVFFCMKLVDARWSGLFRHFVSWLPITAFTLMLTLFVKAMALRLDAGSIGILIPACLIVAIGSLVCARFAPRLFIGDEGLWVLHRFGWPYGRLP